MNLSSKYNFYSIYYRSDAFDVSLCIAVLHHLSTAERRLAGLRELVRITRPGGLVLVYVWALEQEVKKVKENELKELVFAGVNEVNDHESTARNGDEAMEKHKENGILSDSKQSFPSKSENTIDQMKLRVNANRDSFEQQDLFVPWKYSGRSKQQENQGKVSPENGDVSEGHVFHRYYHVFQDGELQSLCSHLDNATVEKHYYDKGNWCVILRKTQ